jgi:hypothetical protein
VNGDIFKKTSYLPGNDGAEDYVMWVNLALEGSRFGNVPKNLITYRIHENQISQTQNSKVNTIFDEHRAKYLNALGIDIELIPRGLHFLERVKIGGQFLFTLNQKIPGISVVANYQIYSRYQFRSNGIFTPLIRVERLIMAALASFQWRLAR